MYSLYVHIYNVCICVQFVLSIGCMCGRVAIPVIFSHVQSYHHTADQDTGVLPPKRLGILSIALSAHHP